MATAVPRSPIFFWLTGNRVLKTAFVLRDGPLAPKPPTPLGPSLSSPGANSTGARSTCAGHLRLRLRRFGIPHPLDSSQSPHISTRKGRLRGNLPPRTLCQFGRSGFTPPHSRRCPCWNPLQSRHTARTPNQRDAKLVKGYSFLAGHSRSGPWAAVQPMKANSICSRDANACAWWRR